MEEDAKRGDIRAESDKTKNNIMGLECRPKVPAAKLLQFL